MGYRKIPSDNDQSWLESAANDSASRWHGFDNKNNGKDKFFKADVLPNDPAILLSEGALASNGSRFLAGVYGETAKRIQALWTPADIATEGWWDASDLATITEGTGGVAQLADKSGNDQHLTQPTESFRPATGTHTLNDLNMFFYDGTDAMATYGDDFVVPASGNFSVFQLSEVFLPLSNVSEGMFSMLNAAGRDWQYVGGVNVNDWNGRMVVSELGGVNTNFSPPAGIGPSIYNVEFDFDSSSINGYVSGNAVGGTDYTLKVTSPQTFITMSNRVGNTLAGHVGETIIVEDPSEGLRQIIEGYLAWKWNLVSQLPMGHPYKDNPPLI